jgi:hypothetical protein
MHKLMGAWLQSQLPVQFPLALHPSIAVVLQELQELPSHSPLHFERTKALQHCDKQSMHDIVGPGPGAGAGFGGNGSGGGGVGASGGGGVGADGGGGGE